MKLSFNQAWANKYDLRLGWRTATMYYRGAEIEADFNLGDFDVLKRYHKEEGEPTTRAERTEYRDNYIWICEQIIKENK